MSRADATRSRLPFGPRVDVSPALDGAERVGQVALTAVKLVAETGVLRTPVDLLGLPGDVRATEAEPKVENPTSSSATLPAYTSRSAQ